MTHYSRITERRAAFGKRPEYEKMKYTCKKDQGKGPGGRISRIAVSSGISKAGDLPDMSCIKNQDKAEVILQ